MKTAAVTFALKKLHKTIFAKYNKIKIQAPEIAPYLLLQEKQTKTQFKGPNNQFSPTLPSLYLHLSQPNIHLYMVYRMETHTDIYEHSLRYAFPTLCPVDKIDLNQDYIQ